MPAESLGCPELPAESLGCPELESLCLCLRNRLDAQNMERLVRRVLATSVIQLHGHLPLPRVTQCDVYRGVCACVHACACVHVCMCAHVCALAHTCVRVCACVCVFVRLCVHQCPPRPKRVPTLTLSEPTLETFVNFGARSGSPLPRDPKTHF